ncbi:MAG TPA: DUF5134 domain-containing protein [Acidimicrobiales bacterium]|nr:DUF5134 domain-containing protein [Acidimicrobiales bacterium]
MDTPSWLYYLFGVAMLVVAAYGVFLLLVSFRFGDPAGRDVDIAHLFMGVAMAGMFVSRWTFWPSGFWELVFFVLMVWFIARSAQSIQRFGLHIPHEAIHVLMSLAMLLMYWFPMAASSNAMSMTSSSSHRILDPGVGLLLAFTLFGSAIFTLASPIKGASHHGTHAVARRRALAPIGSAVSGGDSSVEAEAEPHLRGDSSLLSAIASPQLEDLSHVVMCIGMGFLLVLML